MKTKISIIFILFFTTVNCFAIDNLQDKPAIIKERVFVLTDISNEPDDEESMVRFLVYSNQYDIEGIVATTSTWLKNKTREDLIRRQVETYGQVRNNLLVHEPGFPTIEQLLAVVATGQTNYGMDAVGKGKSTLGSRLLLAAADKTDERPIWVCLWGGANTLAQALWGARAERTPEDLKKLIKKLKVYSISDQDDAGAWLRREFSDLFYVVSPSSPDGKEYCRATWTGISGDRFYKNGPRFKFDMVDNPWLEENIINNHGSLGSLYRKLAYIMEGDSPTFLGLINNGLGSAVSPSYGGWGGRYVYYRCYGETHAIWTNNIDSRDCVADDSGRVECSDQATIWRWREQFQNDFAARMDWCVANEYSKANHNPVAVLNGDKTKNVIEITTTPNSNIELSAAGSSDPDGNKFKISWYIYSEAGNYKGKCNLSSSTVEKVTLSVSDTKKTATVHVILQLQDNGTPNLFAYRRAIITIRP